MLIVSAGLLRFDSAQSVDIKSLTFKGKIVAFCPFDTCTNGDVKCHEHFLFQREGENKAIVKLVYTHLSSSDIKENIRCKGKSFAIIVNRDPSCDQTLEMFEEDARNRKIGEDKSNHVRFTDTEIQKSPKSYPLECYRLDRLK
jgi:hypothetical protein